MTDRELLQQALIWLDDNEGEYSDEYQKFLDAIRTRLAQPDGVEGEVRVQIRMNNKWFRDSQLEAAIATGWIHYEAPKKEWVGLTDSDLIELVAFTHMSIEDAKSVEAKLKEKNAA
jgi:hypothetical protein